MADRKPINNVYWKGGWAYLRVMIGGVRIHEPLRARYASVARHRAQIRIGQLCAEQWEVEHRAETESEPLPLADMASRYLEQHGPTLRHQTRRDYAARIEAFRKWVKRRGVADARAVTTELISSYRAARLGKVSEAAALSDLRPVRAAFHYAWLMEWLDKDPFARLPRVRRKAATERRVLAWADIKALVRAAPGPDVAYLLGIAALAGLRRGELVALEWEDIDFGQGEIHVVNKAWHVTKSGQARSVPLARLLRFWLPKDRAGRIFTTARHPANLSRVVTAAFRRSGLRKKYPKERLGLHLLRHTWLSYLALLGYSINDRRQWAGHAKSDTTDKYTHVRQRVAAEDIAAFRRAFAV